MFNSEVYTPLIFNILKGDLNKIKELVSGGASLLAKDNRGEPPITNAVYAGNLDIVKYLVENGVDVNEKDSMGKNALMYAACGSHKFMLKYLVSIGVKIDPDVLSYSPLMEIAKTSFFSEYIDVLVKSCGPTDINFKDDKGMTALMYSISNDHEDLTFSLLKHGADPNIQDNEGRTALMLSAEINDRSRICELLDHGADNSLRDNYGCTATDYAKDPNCLDSLWDAEGGDGKIPEIVNYALDGDMESIMKITAPDENGNIPIDVDVKDYKGDTALIHAVIDHNTDLTKYLIDIGADPNIKNNDGRSALFFCICPVILKYIIDNTDADVNSSDKRGMTVLMESVYGDTRVLDILLENGADVNSTNKKGVSALMLAAERDNIHAVIRLIEKGADHKLKDKDGHDVRFYIKNALMEKFLLKLDY